jgi:hypothetical protein
LERKQGTTNVKKGKKEQQQFTRKAINNNIKERKESTAKRMVCRRNQV